MRTRLRAHDADVTKEFFTRAVVIVSKDENLTKAHGRYLESRLIEAIRRAGRAKLVNGTEPPFRGLPEAEIADMERVLDEIEVLLPVLGFDVLQPSKMPEPKLEVPSNGDPCFVLDVKKASARAVERGGEFVVLANSTALRRESDAIPQSVKDARQALREAGLLIDDADPELLRFAQDASFGSPSGASAAIAGRADNGRNSWRLDGDGKTYGAWRTGLLGEATAK